MKTLKCDLCEVTAEGETFEDWMKTLMPHYMQAHSGEMKKSSEMSKEDQQKHREQWMAENKKRFESV